MVSAESAGKIGLPSCMADLSAHFAGLRTLWVLWLLETHKGDLSPPVTCHKPCRLLLAEICQPHVLPRACCDEVSSSFGKPLAPCSQDFKDSAGTVFQAARSQTETTTTDAEVQLS